MELVRGGGDYTWRAAKILLWGHLGTQRRSLRKRCPQRDWRLEACVRRHNMWPNLLQLLWLQLLRYNILSECLQRFFLCTWKGYCNFSTERDEGNICDTTNEMYIYYIKLILCMQIYLIYMYMLDICICHSWFPVTEIQSLNLTQIFIFAAEFICRRCGIEVLYHKSARGTSCHV